MAGNPMGHFDFLLFFCLIIYFAECLLWVPSDGWLFLAWGRRFTLLQGPSLRLKNPWPSSGFSYRFPPSENHPWVSPPSLSLEKAHLRLEEFKPWFRTLGWFGRGLLVVAALGFLLFALRRGFWAAWGLLAFAFLFLHLSAVQTLWRAHRHLYPG